MQRRLVLALGALAVLGLLAGCSSAGSIDLRAVNASTLAEDASRDVDTDPRPHGESQRPPSAVVRAAVTNGSTTVTAVDPPVDRGLPYAVDGRYYNLSRTVVDRQTATVVTIEIDYNATTTGTGTNRTVAYESLPPADREALDALLPQRVPDQRGTEFGVGAVYTDAERNASVLVPVQQYDAVVFRGERYPIDVGDGRSVTVRTYRYEASVVARNATAYAAQLRERYAFVLTDLSAAQQSVIETAIEDTYYAESDDDATFEGVLDRFRARQAITRDQESGTWLVRYEGDLYVADLRWGGFLGD